MTYTFWRSFTIVQDDGFRDFCKYLNTYKFIISAMNILIIGSGGREHALCWKIAQSPLCDRLYCLPGNAGIAQRWECPPLKVDNFSGIIAFAKASEIDFTVVGPEAPLVNGIVDRFQDEGLKIFGPTSSAAIIEGDKAFAKDLMASNGIPTARFSVCHDYYGALDSPLLKRFPAVIKIAGLAAGKGVMIVSDSREVDAAFKAIFRERIFGHDGNTVVIEECLFGEEISIFALTDGTDFITFPVSQDHKRAEEGDVGPNTGGMGAYAPAPAGSREVIEEIEERVITPILKAMRDRGTPYKGMLYCGMMLTNKEPAVLEFNCRFGDPETQCILPLVKADLLEMLIAASEEGGIAQWKEKHSGEEIFTENKYAACVVLASKGYPGRYETGALIKGIDRDYPDALIFHAGTKKDGGQIITSGGRVLGVTGMGKTLGSALNKAYSAIEEIEFEGKRCRRDIGWRALDR